MKAKSEDRINKLREVCPFIHTDGLIFKYKPKSNPIIDGLNLKIDSPQLVSIIGPNGAGKSTLIHCMNKILQPTGGCVMVNGEEIESITIKEMAQISSYVPYTSTDSFPLSVTDTIMMGRHPHSKWGSLDEDLKKVHEVMQIMGIEDLAESMFNELSAGQHQKVMLARGLVQEPRILFLDEPTSNLDIKYQLEITRLLKKLSREKGMLVVMISHDLNIASRYSDNVIVLHNRGVYDVGRPEKVMTADMLRTVYGVEAEIIQFNGRPHILMGGDDDFGEDIGSVTAEKS